jgi:hypothetical protein
MMNIQNIHSIFFLNQKIFKMYNTTIKISASNWKNICICSAVIYKKSFEYNFMILGMIYSRVMAGKTPKTNKRII